MAENRSKRGPERRERLEAEHRPEAVRRRLSERHGQGYLGDAVLGGIDGCVTTIAVVAGAVGAGFSGETLERIVEVITNDRGLWVDTMLTEELDLEVEGPSPIRAALATFAAFLVVGLVPLSPFVVPDLPTSTRFLASAVATGVAFFGVGAAKGLVLGRSALRSGLGTLLTGGAAAAVAFVVGALLRQAFGAT
jgi:VIT1/CCC1 family predicted Fe2+/Mn2+ transporter